MRRDERGIALVLAVLVLTVIGALVVAVFFAGVQAVANASQQIGDGVGHTHTNTSLTSSLS